MDQYTVGKLFLGYFGVRIGVYRCQIVSITVTIKTQDVSEAANFVRAKFIQKLFIEQEKILFYDRLLCHTNHKNIFIFKNFTHLPSQKRL